MYAVVRRYAGAVELFEELASRESEIRELITSVPGFTTYQLVRTDDGGFSVTTCMDKRGTDEASRRAAEWIGANIPTVLPGTTPQITEGDVLFAWSSAPERVV